MLGLTAGWDYWTCWEIRFIHFWESSHAWGSQTSSDKFHSFLPLSDKFNLRLTSRLKFLVSNFVYPVCFILYEDLSLSNTYICSTYTDLFVIYQHPHCYQFGQYQWLRFYLEFLTLTCKLLGDHTVVCYLVLGNKIVLLDRNLSYVIASAVIFFTCSTELYLLMPMSIF